MGGIQSVNCFERWGKRRPDGALLRPPRSIPAAPSGDSPLPAHGGGSAPSWLPPPSSHQQQHGSSGSQSPAPSASPSSAYRRPSRRRPSVSAVKAKARLHITEPSEGDDDDLQGSEDEQDFEVEISAEDLRRSKLNEFRKKLKVVVKLGAGVLSSTVLLSLNKDGTAISWSGRDKKPLVTIPLDKLVKVQASASNARCLEISARNPTLEHTLTFKTAEGREAWHESLEALRRFVQIA